MRTVTLMRHRGALLAMAVVFLLALAMAGIQAQAWWRDRQTQADLSRRVQLVQPWPSTGETACPWRLDLKREPGALPPLLLLVFGQSNAGNHGGETAPSSAPGLRPRVTATDGTRCWRLTDPLPGATGRAQSIWSRLEAALAEEGLQREVVVLLLAVDSTRVADWTDPEGPLHSAFADRLRRAAGLPVDLVLWQQGESDARAETSAVAYGAAWGEWLRSVRAAGVKAPVMPALSTRCRNPSGAGVREALMALPQRWPGVVPGPDTDTLSGALRERDCHFTPSGLDEAARLWARSIKRQVARP